jgi:hypothetical protein
VRLGHHQAQYAPSTRQPGTATIDFFIIAIKETVSQDFAQVPLVRQQHLSSLFCHSLCSEFFL